MLAMGIRVNKKQLIVALAIGVLLTGCSSLPTKPNPFPKNKSSIYQYDNPPEICFFPTNKAKWDGYKVTNKNWEQLTDYQKSMFISEANEEIKRNEPVIIEALDTDRIIIALNGMTINMQKQIPRVELAMIKILYDLYKEMNAVKLNTKGQKDIS